LRARNLFRPSPVQLKVRRGTGEKKAQFTPQEQQGYDLFRGKGRCNECHRDGGPGEDPLFTDFTASNIGTPANPRLPYYEENRPDALGIPPIRKGRHSSMAASALSSSKDIC
jgi:cytochrome c peroxidase